MLLFPFRYLWWLIASARARLGRPPEYIVLMLENELPALPDPPRPFWQRFVSRPRLSLWELRDRLDAIAKDSRIKGIVLHLRPVPMSMASLQELRELVSRLRGAGKRVVAWAPFYTSGTYYLACACDQILLLPTGTVQPLGFSTTGMFLALGLARFGIQADFVQISPYKSAADVLTKSKMSDELREQLRWLLESEHEELVAAIAESRRIDPQAAKEIIDGSPYADDRASEKGIVDAVVSEEQLPAHLGAGTEVTLGNWDQARRKVARPAPSLGRGPYVAIMRIEGTIMDGRSTRPPVKPPIDVPIFGDARAGDLTVVQLARQVAADKRAAAVVLYVNSRGGSVTASEAMRQALDVIGVSKPLVVAMGPIAGSGGYWVAMPGRWVIARPSTLTGSIGVLSGKVVTGGLWSKLQFNRETIAFGKHATLDGEDRPYTAEERQIMRRHCDIGHTMLNRIPFLSEAAEIVLAHQEFYDGSGYPRGLRGEDIPLGARIFAVADALDAMISDRPYRRALPIEHAREEIQRCAGTQFDPKVVEVFLSLPDSLWLELRENIGAPFRLSQLKNI
jgi:protease-4